jgi:hypothetical protein
MELKLLLFLFSSKEVKSDKDYQSKFEKKCFVGYNIIFYWRWYFETYDDTDINHKHMYCQCLLFQPHA